MAKKKVKKQDWEIIDTPYGQWEYPGAITRIPSNDITMQGVPYPVLGVSDTNDIQMMYPNQDYQFDGSSVTEYPMMQTGGRPPLKILDPREFKIREQAYNDSLNLYNKFKDAKNNYKNLVISKGFNPAYIEEWATNGYVDTGVHPTIGAVRYGILQNSGGGYEKDSRGIRKMFDFYPTASGTDLKVYKDTELGKAIRERYPIYEKPVQPVVYEPRPNQTPIQLDREEGLLESNPINLGDINPIPFEPGSYFTRERKPQEADRGKMEYFDKKTGRSIGLYDDGGELPEAGNGYKVVRSSERKGKTHKVTGPDGTVKFFGDSKLGQHPKDPARKKAFYARHKKNLAGNPYFRAFARKTWEEGGELNNWEIMQEGGNYPQNLNELENKMMRTPQNLSYSLADRILRGANISLGGGHNDNIDALRHSGTAMYSTSAQGPLLAPFKIPYTNLLGLAHEAKGFVDTYSNPNRKKTWTDFKQDLKETGSDLYNNFIGSTIGGLPISLDTKEKLLKKAHNNNLLSILEPSLSPEKQEQQSFFERKEMEKNFKEQQLNKAQNSALRNKFKQVQTPPEMAFGGNLILEKYQDGGSNWEILPEAQNGKITLNEFRPVFTQESTMTKAPLMPLSDQAKKAAENKALTQKMENLREETRREEQRYQPSTATNVTKAGLAAASLATHNPYTMATLAGGDIATGLKYGWDAIKNFDTTQAKNAFRDFSFAALDFFPEAKAAALAKYGPKILKGTKVAKDVNIMSHALPGSMFNTARPAINAVDYGKPNPYLSPIQFQQRYNTFQSDTKPPIKIRKNGGKMSDWEIVNEWEII